MQGLLNRVGGVLVDAFHYLALFAIGGTVVWSAVYAFFGMAGKGHASIEDILLLFIYLELGAMVGIYFKTNHMPDWGIVMVSGAILLLAFANLVVRYGSARFPSTPGDGRR